MTKYHLTQYILILSGNPFPHKTLHHSANSSQTYPTIPPFSNPTPSYATPAYPALSFSEPVKLHRTRSYKVSGIKLHVLKIALVANYMCCELHMLQIACVANCTYCKFHGLQSACVVKCMCCKVHVLQSAHVVK